MKKKGERKAGIKVAWGDMKIVGKVTCLAACPKKSFVSSSLVPAAVFVVVLICLGEFCGLARASISNERFTNSFYVRLRRSDFGKAEVDALAAKHGMQNWGMVRIRSELARLS